MDATLSPAPQGRPPITTVADFVELFGGPARLSAKLGGDASRKRIGTWMWRNKIPGDWSIPLLKLCRAEGLAISEDDLGALTRRR